MEISIVINYRLIKHIIYILYILYYILNIFKDDRSFFMIISSEESSLVTRCQPSNFPVPSGVTVTTRPSLSHTSRLRSNSSSGEDVTHGEHLDWNKEMTIDCLPMWGRCIPLVAGVPLQSISSNCPQSLRNNLLIPPSLCYYLSWGESVGGILRHHHMLLPSVMNIVMELLRPPETGLLTIVTNLEIERQSPSFLPSFHSDLCRSRSHDVAVAGNGVREPQARAAVSQSQIVAQTTKIRHHLLRGDTRKQI